MSRAKPDADALRPVPCQSKGNSEVVSVGGRYRQCEYNNNFKIEALPPQADFALQSNVIYLEYIEQYRKSRVKDAPTGSSFAISHYDGGFAIQGYVRYLCHFLDKHSTKHSCWLYNDVPGVVVNQGCSFLQTMSDDLLHHIIVDLSEHAVLDHKHPTVTWFQRPSTYLDKYTCPDLLPKDEDSTAAGKYATLKQCCQELKDILIKLNEEHDRQTLAFGKTYIPAKSLDGKPALELPGASFWAKAFSHSESMLHTVCRECWQMVEVCAAPDCVATMANPAFEFESPALNSDRSMCAIV